MIQKHYINYSHKSYKGFISVDFFCPDFQFIFHDPRQLFQDKYISIIRDSRKVTTGVVTVSSDAFINEDNSISLFIKRYNFFNIVYRLKCQLRPSKTFRLLRYALMLDMNGINTAYPVAALERRRAGMCVESYFITREIQHSFDYTAFLRDYGLTLNKVEFLKSIAMLVGKLHKHGFSHGHLSDDNIRVSRQAGSCPALSIIDLDTMKYKKTLSRKDKLKDLASVGADLSKYYSRDEFPVFFETYCHFNPEFLHDSKHAIRQIEEVVHKKKSKRFKKDQYRRGSLVEKRVVI